MQEPNDTLFKRYPLGMYFLLAFIFTWSILSPGVASTLGLLDFQVDGTLLTILGGLGPLLSAIIVTGATDGSDGVRGIISSMFDWRVKARWWGAAVLLIAGLFAIAVFLGVLTGAPVPDPSNGNYLNGCNIILVSLVIFVMAWHRAWSLKLRRNG